MKKVIFGLIIGIISLTGFSVYGMGKVIPKKTPMQNVGNGPYCWTPDGKIAFYRLIDHWIKMEPDPFPGGGGVYDDYEKDDEGFIGVRDPDTEEKKILFKVPFKGAAAPIQYMDWSDEIDEILLSTGLLVAIKPDGSNLRVVVRKEGGLCAHGVWSPDGKRILYAFLPDDPRYISTEDLTKMVAQGVKPGLYIVNANGTSDRFLIDGENGSWSPDGKQVVCQELRKHIIYIINSDGTGKRLLVEGGQLPWWSPDGKWIIYGVTAVSLDGKEQRQIPIVKDIKPPYDIIPGTKGIMTNGMKLTISGKEAFDLSVLENKQGK